MVKLETFLREEIANRTNQLHREKVVLGNSRLILDCTNPQSFTYDIQLHSRWELEQGVKIEHKGKLSEAIETAESKFMEVNGREDVQAEYVVNVVLGERKFEVPKEYWEQYQFKNR